MFSLREVIMWFAESASGFIAPRNSDDGIALPNPKHGKKNGKSKFKQQMAVRQKYVFVTTSKRGQKYRDYFNPNSAVQLRVMGMEDTVVGALPQPTKQHLLFVLFILWLGRCKATLQPRPRTISDTVPRRTVRQNIPIVPHRWFCRLGKQAMQLWGPTLGPSTLVASWLILDISLDMTLKMVSTCRQMRRILSHQPQRAMWTT